MNVKEMNAIHDGQMNRKERRLKEKKTGEKIISLNKPYERTK